MPVIYLLLFLLLPNLSQAADARTNPNCTQTSHTCVDTADRFIGNQWINRPCWHWQDQYQCADGVQTNDCQPYVNMGCGQIGSVCINTIPDGSCGTYQQTYQCQTSPAQSTTTQICGTQSYCVDGTCFDAATTPNGDFAPVVAQYAAVMAAGQEVGQATSIASISIFKGQQKHCNKTVAENCCIGGGWGAGLATCPAEAVALRDARDAHLAHYVGSYCSAKFLGSCTRTTDMWCVFPTRLARIIIEQGRSQLGRGWGAPEAPDCRGFTPEELQSLDFAAMNLTEFYADLQARLTTPDITSTTNTISNRIQNYYSGGATNGGRVGP